MKEIRPRQEKITHSNTPIDGQIVSDKIAKSRIDNIGKASIREIKKLIDSIEAATGQEFIRMEMGVPGLPPAQIGVEAEIAALRQGVAAIYPDIFGIQPLNSDHTSHVPGKRHYPVYRSRFSST